MKSSALGVVVVRIQVPELHEGHRYLLNTVTAIHNEVLVVIGDTEARLTREDPLTFEMRKAMVLSAYPGVVVERLHDCPSDKQWSHDLDSLIYLRHDCSNGPDPVLYGGRNSFLKHYTGPHRTFVLPPLDDSISGTDDRAAVKPIDSADFRRGMIYASKHKYPTAFQCVDAVIIDRDDRVLLGRKKRDGDRYRFIGGFVSTQDLSLEAAVRREVREETGIEPGDAVYIGSIQVDDFRYPKSGTDRLMTAIFAVDHLFGAPRASDDLDEVRWFSPADPEDLRSILVPEHLPLLDLLIKKGTENLL